MDNIKTIIRVGILFSIIWVGIRNILFSKKKDEREILALFNAMKTTILLGVFIIGLVIIFNLLKGITTISIVYIFKIAIICCISLILLYKFNLNTKFCFLDKIEKSRKNKFLWNIFTISVFGEILSLIAIFISYKYFDLRGLAIFVILAYVLAFMGDYLLCTINSKGYKFLK